MIEIGLLGPIVVLRDGVPQALPAGKPRALLLALVLDAGQVVPQHRLIEALWGDQAPERAPQNLHVQVATLRKLLGDDLDLSIETTGGGYCLRIDPDRVDAFRFEQLVHEARGAPDAAARLREALAMWRGPALAELALYASGRQAEALAVYRDLRRRLVEELGIEPSPEVQALERRILQQDTTLAPAPPPRLRPQRRWVWATVGGVLALALAGGISAAVIAASGSGKPRPPPAVTANSLVQLDPETGKVVSVIPVGDTPVSLAVTPSAVWVVNRGDRTVSRVDRRTHVVRPIGGVPYAFDIAADMRGNIWVSDSKDPVISRISAGTGDFPAAAAAPETIRVRPRAGRLAVDGGYLWVTNAVAASGTNANRDQILGAGTVSRIDLRSHRVVSTIPTTQLPLVIASGYGSIWVGNSDANFERSSVSVIGTGSSRAETIDSGVSQPFGIAAGAGSVWILKFDGTLDKIDPQSRRLVARRSVGHDIEVLSLAVGAGSIWVTNRADFSVSKIDPRTGRIERTIRLGQVGASRAESQPKTRRSGSRWAATRTARRRQRADELLTNRFGGFGLEVDDHVRDRNREALLGARHDALLQPVRAALGVCRDDDLVGAEGAERVVDRLHRVGVPDLAARVDPRVGERVQAAVEPLLGMSARLVLVGDEVA